MKSLDLFKRHSRIPTISLEEFRSDFPVHGHWLTMAALNSSAFRMNFKVFFTTQQGAPFCSSIFKKTAPDVNSEQLNDFTKELCNLVIGHIKYDFEKQHVSCAASLPICLRSFDNLFFTKNKANQLHEVYWKFKHENSEIMCLLSMEILDETLFQRFDGSFDTTVKDGGFELL
jgi:hypothetical protein